MSPSNLRGIQKPTQTNPVHTQLNDKPIGCSYLFVYRYASQSHLIVIECEGTQIF